MEHNAKLLAVFFICVFGISESRKESIFFNGKINKIVLVKENVIVAGNGFLASISIGTFRNTSITPEKSKNYSFLSSGSSDQFLTCFENTTNALCFRCRNTVCRRERDRPLFVMRSFGFLQNDNTELFITTQTAADRTYVSVWKPTNTAADSSLTLKPGWTYGITATILKGDRIYGLGKVEQGGASQSIMIELYYRKLRGLDYSQTLTEQFGQAVAFIPVAASSAFFLYLTTENRIGRVTWESPQSLVSHHGVEVHPQRKWSLNIGGDSKKLTVTEVVGVSDALQAKENFTSGLTVNAPSRLFLATNQGRLFKFALVNDTRVTWRYNITISKEPNAQVFLTFENKSLLYGYIRHSSGRDEVFRNKLHDCERHANCSSCVADGSDPDCRWFPLKNACDFDSSPDSGKSFKTCPEIQTVTPPAVSFQFLIKVNVTLAPVKPAFYRDKKLHCQWMLPNRQINKSAEVQNNFLVCPTPVANKQDDVRESTDASLRIWMNGNPLTEKKTVKFFDCRAFRSCTLCQRQHSLGGENFRCMWKSDGICSDSRSGSSLAECLQLVAAGEELRIPNRAPWSLIITGKGLLELNNSDFKCNLNGRAFEFRVLNDTQANCSSSSDVDFGLSTFKTFSSLTISSNATGVIVAAKGGRPLNVTIYECGHLKCDSCLQEGQKGLLCRSRKGTSPKCEPGPPWQPLPIPNCGKNPEVLKVFPDNGPLEGGTRVTFTGNWLGLNSEQLNGRVALAGLKCDSVEVIEPLKSFECTTVQSNKPVSEPFKIWNIKAGPSFSYMPLSAPFNLSQSFCFIDFPGDFHVTIPNFHIGRKRSVFVDGVNLTDHAVRIMPTDVYKIKCPLTAKERKGKMVVTVDGSQRMSVKDFEFLPAPFLKSTAPREFKSIRSGGIPLRFPAYNAFLLSKASVEILSLSRRKPCHRNTTAIICEAPPGTVGFVGVVRLWTSPDVNFTRGRNLTIRYFPNPEFLSLKNTTTVENGNLRLNAAENSNFLQGATKEDYRVTLENKVCKIINVSPNYITCSVGALSEKERRGDITVKVRIGSFLNYTLGVVRFVEWRNPWPEIVFPIIATFLFLAIACFLGFLLYRRRRDNLQKKYLEELDKRMEEEHFAAANASRNAFVEMQTAMEDMQLLDTNAELPYRDFEDFMVAVLLPNSAENAVALAEFEVGVKSGPVALPTPEMVSRFNYQLMSEKPFLLTLIRTFDVSTKLADKSLIAAALSVVLADRMEYYYEVLRELFHHIVKTNVEERKTDALTLLFRRSESLMEKMFSNWLTICLYTHLRNSDTGKKLYIVFKALGKFLNMGPVDAIRCRAKNVLSEDVLLSEEVDFSVITLRGSLKNEDGQLDPVELQVLSCDTIGQVKEKIIEALSPHRPFSMRPAAEDYVLQWQRSTGADGSNAFFLHLETQLTSTSNKLPVIGDLNAKDALVGAHLVLVRLNQAGKMSMGGSMSSFASEADDSTNLLAKDSFGEHIHLCQSNATTTQTVISKDFCLPHLLKTRHVVHTYIEDLFKSIFNIDIMEPPPPYVEHIFGVIDDAVNEVPHDRPMMAHVWKSNSYILRVWVNLLKNPEFLFDVNKSPVVNANLSVIAQALMDACSYNPKPTSQKGLSSTKLVFLRDIEQYRKWVTEFYSKLETKKTLPSDQDMSMLYNTMQNTCKFSGDIMFRATRFLLMKSRDLKPKILDSIDNSQWFHTNEERQNFKDRVEAILGSTCADTTL